MKCAIVNRVRYNSRYAVAGFVCPVAEVVRLLAPNSYESGYGHFKPSSAYIMAITLSVACKATKKVLSRWVMFRTTYLNRFLAARQSPPPLTMGIRLP